MDCTMFKLIIENIPQPIWVKDLDYKFIYVNNEYKKVHKGKIREFIGLSDEEVFDGEMTKIYNEECDYVKNNLKPIVKKMYIEGDVIKCTIFPVIDDNGEIKAIAGISSKMEIVDNPERKEKEEKLIQLSYTDVLTGAYNRAYFEEKAVEFLEEKYLPVGVIMGDANGLKIVNDTLGHIEGDNLLKVIANVFKDVCAKKNIIFRTGGDEFVILVPNASESECQEIIEDTLKVCKRYTHRLIDISIALGASIIYDTNKSIHDALNEAEEKVYRQKLLQENSINNSIIYSLKKDLQNKRIESGDHTERILANSIEIGKRLDLSKNEMDELVIVSKFHDIGKIAISEDILLKPGKLSNSEFDIMKTHAEKGYRIIKASNKLDSIARGVLTHHERWDGNGYPLKLKGEQIPLIARIVSVSDAYEVMTNPRFYKDAMTKEEAINELCRCSGSQFDPKVVKVFVEYLKTI